MPAQPDPDRFRWPVFARRNRDRVPVQKPPDLWIMVSCAVIVEPRLRNVFPAGEGIGVNEAWILHRCDLAVGIIGAGQGVRLISYLTQSVD